MLAAQSHLGFKQQCGVPNPNLSGPTVCSEPSLLCFLWVLGAAWAFLVMMATILGMWQKQHV